MLSIRFATTDDAALLATLIRELAEYDRLGHEAAITEDIVARDAFGAAPKFRSIIAEWNGKTAGFACLFDIYSTFQGRPGLFLEDLFVRPEFRKRGIGRALLARAAKIAWDEGYFCLRWEVLDWNTTAIEFYRELGTVFLDEWKSALLIGDALEAMVKEAH